MIDAVSNILNYSATETEAETPSANLGKEEFLQLLVAELRNQDPLEPMNNAEYIAQMSQFSSLEQLINMNETMSNLINLDYLTSQSLTNNLATSLLDKTITASSNQVYLNQSGSSAIKYSLGATASEVKVTIYDEDGSIVNVLYDDNSLAGMNTIEWDGKNLDGVRVPEGSYAVAIEATASDGSAIDAGTYLIGKVTKIQYLDGAAYLEIDGAMISLGDVVEVEG